MKKSFSIIGVLCWLTLATAQAQLLYFDDFSEFPNGTSFNAETNWVPGPWVVPGGMADFWNTNTAATTVIASNLLGSTRLYFNALANPGGDNAGYAARLSNWGSNSGVTNGVVNVKWLSWIDHTSSLTATGGMSVNVTTTNRNIWCDGYGCSTNLDSNGFLFYADNGDIFAITNSPQLNPIPFVKIGSWGSYQGTIMTNELVLNYPARKFKLMLNGVVITNNMVITSWFTNLFTEVGMGCVEMLPSSAGNKFAIDNVQIVVSNSAKDVQSYNPAAKGQLYLQTSSSAPSLLSTGYLFHAEVQGLQSNSIWSGTVHLPSGGTANLMDDGTGTGCLAFNAMFTSQGALDAAYSNGTYRLSILGANQGLVSPSMNFPAGTYPNTPQIANYDAAQAVNAASDFTLQWNTSGGGTGDFVQVRIHDTGFSTPALGQAGALNGTNTSLVIPAGTLAPGTTYTGDIVFSRPASLDTNSIPGAVGATGYFKFTQFSIATAPPPSTWSANEIRVGPDGNLRLLWTNTTGAVSLWTLNSNCVLQSAANFGPYSGWSLSSEQKNLAIGPDNKAHFYWRHTGGAVSFWTVSSGGVLEAAQNYGPYAGWDPQYLSQIGITSDNKLHCWWRDTGEAISFWTLNSANVLETAANYGPYTGWAAFDDGMAVGPDNRVHLIWNRDDFAISIWNMSSVGGLETAANYGPYAGWWMNHDPKISNDNKLRLLWEHSSGAVSFWLLDSNGAFDTAANFGPYAGWQAKGPLPRPDNKTVLAWRNDTGEYSFWLLNSSGAFETAVNFGPYTGWRIVHADVGAGNRTYVLWVHTSGQVSLWRLSPTLTLENAVNYGPY